MHQHVAWREFVDRHLQVAIQADRLPLAAILPHHQIAHTGGKAVHRQNAFVGQMGCQT